MLVNNQNYLHGRLVGIGKIRKDGSREFRFLEKPLNNMILRCGLNEFMTYNGSNTAVLDARYGKTALFVIDYCGFGTSSSPNNFANTTTLGSPSITPYVDREYRGWPFNGISIESGTANYYKVRVSHKSPAVSESIAVRELGYFKNYANFGETPVNSGKLFSRIVLPASFQLDPGDQLVTTYELVIGIARDPIDLSHCGLHDSSDVELDCQLAQCLFLDNKAIYGLYPDSSPSLLSNRWNYSHGGQGWAFQFAPYNFYDRMGGINGDQSSWDLRYTKSSFNFPTSNIPYMSYRGNQYDKVTCQKTDYTPDSFKRDVIVNVPAYWPEMSNNTDHRDIYAINWGTLFVRFGHFDANMDFTPAPWRKLASRTAKFVFRQSIATVDSLSWTPPSE